jgi:GT2 family glycosyltransferase
MDVRVVIVENGSRSADTPAAPAPPLPENRGFAGGMNAGIERLLSDGCDRILLLNNDAVLEPGCLRLLAEALEDSRLGAVGPTLLRAQDGRVESRGLSVDWRWGRVRMEGHGAADDGGAGLVSVEALSGAAIMLTRGALERVGGLDADYFFSFEDVDWCVRARRAGLGLAVVLGARARHAGSATIGRGSPERAYYATRNHLRAAEKLEPLTGGRLWLRRAAILALNLAHALGQSETGRLRACAAVLDGFRDARRGRFGPRPRVIPNAATGDTHG